MIPPQADAQFAADIAEVLETYDRPYYVRHPVVRMDEQPVQLVKDTHESGGDGEATAAGGLRVRAGVHGGGVNALRASERPAAGDSPQESHEDRLGVRCGGPAGEAFRRLPESHDSAGQSEHAYEGSVLRGIRAGAGASTGALSGLRTQIAAWSADVNVRSRGVKWRMRIDDARCMIEAVYPKIVH